MGVFEQQHCNYEHLFGQALSPDFMCTGQSPSWQGRKTLRIRLGRGAIIKPHLGLSEIRLIGRPERDVNCEPDRIGQWIPKAWDTDGQKSSDQQKRHESDSGSDRDNHPRDDRTKGHENTHGGCA